jgi:hypothetical protein
MNPAEAQYRLQQVAAYRGLCDTVRRSAGGNMIFGLLMLGLGYMTFDPRNPVFGSIYYALGAMELLVGLWNWLRPSAEGVFLDGLVLLAFACVSLSRSAYIFFALNIRPHPISLFIGAYLLYSAVSRFRNYGQLRRAFQQRPTAEHIRWYNDLAAEILAADPTTDPDAVDFPTYPRLKGKLLGDNVFFVTPQGEFSVAGRSEVDLSDAGVAEDGTKLARLLLRGRTLDPCPVSAETWKNFTNWKRSGGA